MKKLFTLMAVVCLSARAMSQTDTIPTATSDTIRIGNMIIIKDKNKDRDRSDRSDNDHNSNNYYTDHGKPSKISTNWFIVDIGFANYNDQTNYANTGGYLYNRAGVAPLGASDFKLNAGKSININIWLFMQRFSLIKSHLNLKYGLGLELNNYRYRSNISYFEKNPFTPNATPAPGVLRDDVTFSKNKLAADYVTVPFMLNFTSNPERNNKGFSMSFGVSAGYLYSQRNKQRSAERGTRVNKGDYDLEQFKISYIGEVGLGPVRLYGSYTPKSMYKNGLDMRPYSLGIRLSNW